MRVLRRFVEFTARERTLVLRAWLMLAVMLVLLSTTRYEWLERRVLGTPLGAGSSPDSVDAIALAVERAAKLVPGATCLVKGLAGAWLMRRAGMRPSLQFGVAKGDEGFKAHAWLECEGRIVIGGSTADQYAPLDRHRDDPNR